MNEVNEAIESFCFVDKLLITFALVVYLSGIICIVAPLAQKGRVCREIRCQDLKKMFNSKWLFFVGTGTVCIGKSGYIAFDRGYVFQ